jgi:hypothetical protein
MARIARMRGTRPHSLVQQLVPGVQFWNRDGDLIAPPALLNALALRTGTDLADVQATTLPNYEGVLAERIRGEHQSAMVRPIGVFHRSRRAHGQQFCPVCLVEDQPYYRLQWRLRLFPTCTKHGAVLLDGCPACGAPVAAHRSTIIKCDVCGSNLDAAVLGPAISGALMLQQHNQRVLAGDAVSWPGFVGLHPLAFFGLQLSLVRALMGHQRGERLRAALHDHVTPQPLKYHVGSSNLRSLMPQSAHQIMACVEILLRGWPTTFVEYLQEAGVWASWITSERRGGEHPYVLIEAVSNYLRPGSAPRGSRVLRFPGRPQ